jgi:hypothetical protein
MFYIRLTFDQLRLSPSSSSAQLPQDLTGRSFTMVTTNHRPVAADFLDAAIPKPAATPNLFIPTPLRPSSTLSHAIPNSSLLPAQTSLRPASVVGPAKPKSIFGLDRYSSKLEVLGDRSIRGPFSRIPRKIDSIHVNRRRNESSNKNGRVSVALGEEENDELASDSAYDVLDAARRKAVAAEGNASKDSAMEGVEYSVAKENTKLQGVGERSVTIPSSCTCTPPFTHQSSRCSMNLKRIDRYFTTDRPTNPKPYVPLSSGPRHQSLDQRPTTYFIDPKNQNKPPARSTSKSAPRPPLRRKDPVRVAPLPLGFIKMTRTMSNWNKALGFDAEGLPLPAASTPTASTSASTGKPLSPASGRSASPDTQEEGWDVIDRYQLQKFKCNTEKYRHAPLCLECLKHSGDVVKSKKGFECYYRERRSFALNSRGKVILNSPPTIFSTIEKDDIPLHPKQYDQMFTKEHARLLKSVVATNLLPTMRKQLKHAGEANNAIRYRLDLKVRSTCDGCLHCFLSGSVRSLFLTFVMKY